MANMTDMMKIVLGLVTVLGFCSLVQSEYQGQVVPLGCTDCHKINQYCDLVVHGQQGHCVSCEDPCRDEALQHNDRCREHCPEYFKKLLSKDENAATVTTSTESTTEESWSSTAVLAMALIAGVFLLCIVCALVAFKLVPCFVRIKECWGGRCERNFVQETQPPSASDVPGQPLLNMENSQQV